MDKRRMADIKLENGKVHKIIHSNHDFDEDTDNLNDGVPFNKEQEKEINDKIDKFINSRNSKRTLEKTPRVKEKKNNAPLNRWVFIVFILVLFCGAIYFSSIVFEKAQVSIVSKKQSSTLSSKQFVASKDANSSLGFEIMIMSGEEPEMMTLTQTQNVSTKATGQVALYNEFSKTSQKLVVGTFISDETGKTYRLNKAVVVPGYKTDKSNKIIPGSISVGITAFLPGSSYNGTPTDFHFVDFKGTTKYQKIYAKAMTPLAGGASGLYYVLSDKEKAGITDVANSQIKEDLIKKLNAEIPEGYIFYPGSIVYTYNLGDTNLYENAKTEVNIMYNLSVVLLKKDDLTKTIVKSIITGATTKQSNEITISDLSKLSFAFVSKDQLVDKGIQSVTFTLTGDVDMVWNPNVESIRNELVGIPKTNMSTIFNADETIASANLKIFPPWQKNFPTDRVRIKIIVQ